MKDLWTYEYDFRANALRYLKQGLCPIPLQAHGKEPAIRWAEFQKRKPTEEEIKNWATQFPDANIGIMCGAVSGNLCVIDFDDLDLCHSFWRGDWAKTKTTLTSRGVHGYFFSEAKSQSWKVTFQGNIQIISLLSDGHYVVAPPSIHPTGVRYKFVDEFPIQKFEGDLNLFIQKRLEELDKDGILKLIETTTDKQVGIVKKKYDGNDVIGRIKDIPISEIYERFTGKTAKGKLVTCPFHSPDKKPSLALGDRGNYFKCFGCGASGSAIDFVSKLKGVSVSEAIAILRKEFGI